MEQPNNTPQNQIKTDLSPDQEDNSQYAVGISNGEQPIMSYGSLNAQNAHTSRGKLYGLVFCIVSFVVIIGYFLAFPLITSQIYLSSINDPYKKQTEAMNAVYDTLALPIFTDNNSNYETDKQNFATINSVTTTANSTTKTLTNADSLITLPGTTWLPQVKKANTEHKKMQQYVIDSQNFLSGFDASYKYLSGLDDIVNHQYLSTMIKVGVVGKGANSADIQQKAQEATTALSQLIADVKSLQPGDDFKGFHNDFLTGLNGLKTGLDEIASGLSSKDAKEVSHGLAITNASLSELNSTIAKGSTSSENMLKNFKQQAKHLQSQTPLSQ